MKKTGDILISVLIGGVLLNGNVINASGGLWAERGTQPVFVDGQKVELETYNIAGSNYVKLRDIGKAVGFNVYYQDGSVQVESSVPYTGEPHAPTEVPESRKAVTDGGTGLSSQADIPDYSAQADSTIFKETYTREMYNALRHTILTKEDSQKFTLSGEEIKQTCWNVTAAIGEWPVFELMSEKGEAHFRAFFSDTYRSAAEFCQPFIDSLDGKSDCEKVKAIAFYVCDRLEYRADSTSAPNRALIDKGVHYGNCMSYAHNFKFLCDMASIPCIFTHSSIHQWNQIYLEGTWWSVDVSAIDKSYTRLGDTQVLYEGSYLQGDIFQQTQPELTKFAKETLVPGSTK